MKPGIFVTLILAGLAVAGIIGYVSTRDVNQNVNTNNGGDRVEADGTIVKADGTMIKPDGTMVGPDGQPIETSPNTNSTGPSNMNASSQGPSASYVDYSTAVFGTARATAGKTVLYFHADWCPVCRILEPSIRSNLSDLPNGLTILKVNYDTATDLKQKYGVTYQHTFVQVDADGNKLKLWNGSTDARAIADEII